MKPSFPRLTIVYLGVILLLSVFVIAAVIPITMARAQTTASLVPAIKGDLGAHDPSLIKQGKLYYVFSTGGNLQIRTSPDLVTWTFAGTVFSEIPTWVTDAVGVITDLWAPDITFHNGVYYLYYAGSHFGTNTSVIGLATNTTLNPADKNYRWVDRGLVIGSTFANNYNTIDPTLSFDANGVPWLSFGSFWSGLKLHRLDAYTMKLSASDATLYSLAERAAPDALEAPFIVHHGRFYYLFASVDFCCQGVDSTYKTVVGRASSITGPYLSQAGMPMLQGGFTVLLQRSGNVVGPGGESVYGDLLIHHYYDGAANGAIKIQIRKITWRHNWPILSGPIS